MVTAFVDPVVVASQEGVIIEVNEKMLQLFGYDRKEVIGKSLKILMPASVAEHHDEYIKAYLDTGVTKLIGKPRSLTGKHKDGSDLQLVLSLGVETTEKKKTFIATLRVDKEKKNIPSQQELDAILKKSVDSYLEETGAKIKETLNQELLVIMKRLEEYQAASKLQSAKNLKDRSGRSSTLNSSIVEDTTDESDMNLTTRKGDQELTINCRDISMGHRLGTGGSGAAVYSCNIDGWECACKELKIQNSKQCDIDAFLAEIFMLESLPPHKNLVRFLFHRKSEERIQIFMRRYEGTLDELLHQRKEKDEFFSLDEVARLALDVVRALEVLHDFKILHRDVSYTIFLMFFSF